MKASDRIPFRDPRKTIVPLDSPAVARLAEVVGDLSLMIDADGRILDASFSAGDPTGQNGKTWIDRSWSDTVTIESRPKISEMIESARAGESPRWRQVNHPTANGDVPVKYLAVAAGANGRVLAIGQDLRATAAMQQRLIQAQQSLERDYLRLRQAEARYKLLFDMGTEPVLIVDAESRRIREANPAAAILIGAKPGALVNRPLTTLFDASSHDAVVGYLGTVAATDSVDPVTVRLAEQPDKLLLSATAYRQDRAAFYLVRLTTADMAAGGSRGAARLLDVLDRLPDAFVLADAKLKIVTANPAFLDFVQEASIARLKDQPVGSYLGRAGIDVDLIVDQLREHGSVRNIATILRGSDGSIEQVEVSAVAVAGNEGNSFGFSIRSIERRMREAPEIERDLPRSVEQLTDLVGRMSLKDIVRESTDLIERLCIEAALTYTSDNRASAAEILGVSRQSLYSKLHRHGLGNLVSEED
jgi:transcriptional regulator PpsR